MNMYKQGILAVLTCSIVVNNANNNNGATQQANNIDFVFRASISSY